MFLRSGNLLADVRCLLGKAPPLQAWCHRSSNRRNKLRSIVALRLCSCSKLKNILALRWLCVLIRQRWRAHEELKVYIAAVGNLGDVVGTTPERLFSNHLTSKLLVTIVGVSDVRRRDKGLATTTSVLEMNLFYTGEPKATRGHLVGTQTLLGLELLLDVLDASFCAIVLVIGTMVVEGVLREVRGPSFGIGSEVCL